jgi:hypothetical protein
VEDEKDDEEVDDGSSEPPEAAPEPAERAPEGGGNSREGREWSAHGLASIGAFEQGVKKHRVWLLEVGLRPEERDAEAEAGGGDALEPFGVGRQGYGGLCASGAGLADRRPRELAVLETTDAEVNENEDKECGEREGGAGQERARVVL